MGVRYPKKILLENLSAEVSKSILRHSATSNGQTNHKPIAASRPSLVKLEGAVCYATVFAFRS